MRRLQLLDLACNTLATDRGGEIRIGPRRCGSGFAFGRGNLGAVEIEFGIMLQDIRNHRIQSHLVRWNGCFGGTGCSLARLRPS